MKIFDTKKTASHFKNCLDFVPEDVRPVFTNQVKDLFWEKNLSEDGKYSTFKVTKKDIDHIVQKMVDSQVLVK